GNAVCYVAWNIANVQLGIVKCSAYIYMTPFITLIVGYLVLQEAISWMAVAGAVCIIAGMILSNRKQGE
ncbi:MAG: EamA family transporter, partial [Erysipelotrichaceae bacterium]|nr:EamA family transporter [Erysipelotrichaceae bacterium]